MIEMLYNGLTIEQLKKMQDSYQSLSDEDKARFAAAVKELPADLRAEVIELKEKEVGFTKGAVSKTPTEEEKDVEI